MALDIENALRAGYTLPEIVDYIGQQKKVDVSSARQAGYSDSEIVRHLMGGAQSPKTGFLANVGAGVENLKGDFGSIGAAFGVSGAEDYARKQQQLASEKATIPEFSDIAGVGDAYNYVSGLAGRSLPYMVAPIAAAVSAPAGIAAAAAGTAAGAIQFFGTDLTRQLQEGKSAKDLDIASAAAAAPFQAALDTVGFRYIPGLRKIFGQAGVKMSDDALRDLMKTRMTENLAGKVINYGTKAVQTAGVEGFTEAGQQVLERAQAGLNITDPAARKEYFDSFIGGAVLGGTLAVPGTAIERSGQKAQYEQLLRKDAAAAAAAKQPVTEAAPADSMGFKPTPVFPDTYAEAVQEVERLKQETQTAEIKARIAELEAYKQRLLTEDIEGMRRKPYDEPKSLEDQIKNQSAVQGEFRETVGLPTREVSAAEEAPAVEKEAPTVLDANTLNATGLSRQSGIYKQLLGKDLTDLEGLDAVMQIVERAKANPNLTPETKQALDSIATNAFNIYGKQAEMFGPRGGVLEPIKPEKVTAVQQKIDEVTKDKDLTDPAQVEEIRAALTDYANAPNRSAEAIAELTKFLDTLPSSAPEATDVLKPTETIDTTGQSSPAMVGKPKKSSPRGTTTSNVTGVDDTGAAIGQPDVGTPVQPTALATPPAAPKAAAPFTFRQPTTREKSVNSAAAVLDLDGGSRVMFADGLADVFLVNSAGKEVAAIRKEGTRAGEIKSVDDFSSMAPFVPESLRQPLIDYREASRNNRLAPSEENKLALANARAKVMAEAKNLGNAAVPAQVEQTSVQKPLTTFAPNTPTAPNVPARTIPPVAPTPAPNAPTAPNAPKVKPPEGRLSANDAITQLMANGYKRSEATKYVRTVEENGTVALEDIDNVIGDGAKKQLGTAEAQPSYTPEQREMAELHASRVGGTIVWQNGDLALIRGYSIGAGTPVYMAAKGDTRTQNDIEAHTGTVVTAEEKETLVKEKQKVEAADAKQHSAKPFPSFVNEQIITSASTPKEIGGIIKGWSDLLGIKANIYISTVDDVRKDKDKFTGPYRAIGSSALDANNLGEMRRLPNGDYYITFAQTTSKTGMLETLAHELGHVHQKEMYDNASPELKESIKKEHNKWLIDRQGETGRQLVDALRAKTTAKRTTVAENKMAADLKSYWRSFDEWYADQVSRWATTNEKPISVVEKFFARLGRAMREFFGNIKNKRYLPNETFVQYLEKVKEAAVKDATSTDTVATKADNFTQWFGNSVARNENGTPKVMYHGTAQDIETFKPKQANAIFVTDDPKFAESFAEQSEHWMQMNTDKFFTDAQIEEFHKEAEAIAKRDGTSVEDEYRQIKLNNLPSRANIVPVYVSVQNPFDFQNPEHVKAVIDKLNRDHFGGRRGDTSAKELYEGSWETIESRAVQEAIKELGFDGFYIVEGGKKNLAVYEPSQIKSVFNKGNYDKNDGRISYQLGSTEDLTPAGKEAAELNDRMKGAGNPNPADPDSILKKTLGILQPREGETSLGTKFRHAVVDASAPATEKMVANYGNKLTDSLGEVRGDLAQIQAQDTAAFAEGVMEHGGIRIGKDNLVEIVDRDATMGKVFDIMTQLGNRLGSLKTAMQLGHNAFIAQRAKELNAHNAKIAQDIVAAEAKGNKKAVAKLRDQLITHYVTDEEIAAADEAMQKFPELKEAFKTFTEYKNGLIDFLVQTGRISQAKATDWKEAAGYVPWTRVEEVVNAFDESPPSFKGGVASISKERILDRNGSQKEIANVFDNMIGLTSWAVKTGMNTYASRRMAESLPDAFELTNDDAIAYAQKYNKDRLVFTYKDGERTAYMLGSPLDKSAFASNIVTLGPILKAFSFAQSTLRSFVTHMPAFALSQLIQDGTYRAMLLSGVKHPFSLPVKVAKNFIHAMAGEGIPAELARIGVSGVYDGMPQHAVERARVKYGLEERNNFKKAWDKLEKFSLAADLAVRAAIYEQTLNETKSAEMPEGDRRLALYRAKEYINFKRAGNSTVIGTMRHMVPFLNAYIQGMDILVRTMQGKGISLEDKRTAQKLFLATGLKLAAMSTLYAMLAGDDDDYKGMEDYERDKNYIIPGTGLKIPVAPEVGFMFKVIPERIVRYVVSQGTERPQDATAFYKGFKDAFIAAYSGTNLTPQLVKPGIEILTNYSFFTGNPIVGAGMKNLDPSMQFTEGTSELAKLFGMVGISPMKADYLIRGYTGMLGAFVLDATDAVANPDRMGKPVSKLPQLSTFMYDTTGRGYKSEFYSFRESVDQVVDTVNMFKREGRMEELRNYMTEENMKLYAMKGIVNKAETQLANLRKYRNIIAHDPQMPADLKREKTDEILKQEKELLLAYNLPKLRGMAGM